MSRHHNELYKLLYLKVLKYKLTMDLHYFSDLFYKEKKA